MLALSLLLHLLTWGGYELGQKYGWWQQSHWPVWLHRLVQKVEPPPKPPVNDEEPLTFVTVNEPATEAPKNAKFYSSQNSKAANPDADRDANQPKLTGKQTDAPKAEDVPRVDFSKLQPSPPAEKAQPQKPQQPKPQLAMNMGDLTLGKPQESQNPQAAQQPRPRTVNEALARQSSKLPAVQMLQSGGVQNRRLTASFDAKGTPFGAYDEAIIEAVQQHWDDLLDSRQFALDRTGKVSLRFHLNYDGTVSDMAVLENKVGETLGYVCQQAINEPAPFAAWPPDMRRMVGQNYREITFTFYYY